MRKRYIDGPFGQLHLLDAEHGRPVLLLHQAIMSGHQFDRVFEPLQARGLRPIAVDMPGFGQSDPTPVPPHIADYAAILPAILEALALPCVPVAGHHTGSLVATEMAVQFPQQVSAAVMGGIVLPDPAARALWDEIMDREKRFRPMPEGAHFVEIARIREHYAAGTIPPERISDYVMQAMQAWQQGAYWWGHHAAFSYDQGQRLMQITQPALLLTNTGDMLHQSTLKAHALRPDFALTALEGGGIDVTDQNPIGWADAVADFLESVPPQRL